MERRSGYETSSSNDEYALKYGHLDLFRDVDISSVAYLLDKCEEVEVEAGLALLEEGAANDSIYIVLEGALQVRLGATNAAPLLSLGIGACVGELSILSRLNVSAHVIAQRASRLLVIKGELLWSFIGSSHEAMGAQSARGPFRPRPRQQ